jgi:FkbM family methyltransferase
MNLPTVQKLALARQLSRVVRLLRRAAGLPAAVRVRRRGIEWSLDLTEGIDLSIYLRGCFEPSTVKTCERLLRPGSIAIDVGANIGSHTLPMARLVGNGGHVYAFEPTLYGLHRLRLNLSLNPVEAQSVTLVHAYLTDDLDATVPDAIPSSWPLEVRAGLHALHRGRPMPTGEAAAMTFDRFVVAQGLQRVDFMKIDVDGGEAAVLAGARETIMRCRPALIVEFAPQTHADQAITAIVDLLRAMNYRLHDLGRRNILPLDAHALSRRIKVGSSINVLCLPLP